MCGMETNDIDDPEALARAERETRATARFGPVAGVLQDVPSLGWVVHELHRQKENQPILWAWCRVSVDEPGYSEVHFTASDGTTIVDGPAAFRLGAVIVKLWC